ncbi:MAG: SMC-Scp complex subunit ScpB [Candidatus Omnitrophota bacterium]
MDKDQAKSIIEAMFFVTDKPLFINEIKGVLEEFDAVTVRGIIADLAKDYEDTNRSFRIREIAGGFQIVTDPNLAPWLKRLYKTSGADRLTGPSLETLAIIAYKQPVTKPEIEAIRGVNVDGVLKTLVEKNLVKIAGRRETPGRPILYGTTQEFLQYFGLNSLEELPRLEEFHVTEEDIELPEHLKKDKEEVFQMEPSAGPEVDNIDIKEESTQDPEGSNKENGNETIFPS